MISLAYKDFWPACLLAEEGFKNAQFERYDALIPKANSWLRQNPRAEVTKCQTLEKRVTSPEQIGLNNPKADLPSANTNAYNIKGLRMWYYIMSPSHSNRLHAMQIAYRNFLPRCVENNENSWPEFEDLTELYTAINNELDQRPVEGCILTVETVALHVAPNQLSNLAGLQADQCQWCVTGNTSLLYITRVFYCFQCPAYEQVGAADFFPDHQMAAPKPGLQFSSFSTIMAKVNCWLTKVKDIRITNIQTLETLFEPSDQEDKLETSTNFLPPDPTSSVVRFIRVTYVRPKYGLPPGGLHAPRAVWFKNFVPTSLLEGNKSKKPGEEVNSTSLWERVQHWSQSDNKTLLDVEVLYYPLTLVIAEKEDLDTTVISGLDTETLMQVLRVYYSCSGTRPAPKPETPTIQETKSSCVMA